MLRHAGSLRIGCCRLCSASARSGSQARVGLRGLRRVILPEENTLVLEMLSWSKTE